ncbi:MAG: hypothetical protein HUJ97_04570 [Bacteroidales bacterium]|nr:hypothetical protein [Bacteroidales bacterium]
MKTKVLLTAMFICISFSAMAQRHQRNGQRGQGPQSLDMVVDTAIINSMNLDAEIQTAVLELQKTKADELKATIIKMASSQPQGQQPTPESIAAMQKQIADFKTGYRSEFRKILGDENYIIYLEKQVDKRPQMGAGMGNAPRQRRGNFNGNPQGNNMNGGQGSWGGGQGNWGNAQGGFEGNGGFGEE